MVPADFTAWLSEHLDKEEALAHSASHRGASWSILDGPPLTWGEHPRGTEILAGGKPILHGDDEYGAAAPFHVVTHDPARVLREVAVKREILALHRPDRWGGCYTCGQDDGYGQIDAERFPCQTVRLLASPYAEPGHEPEWQPAPG